MTNQKKKQPVKDMTQSVNEREIVLDILMELENPEAMCHMVLNSALAKYQYLLKQQRSFITRVAQGTIEKRITLDYIIDSYSNTPVRKMKPLIRNLLEMSVYQIRFMDNIPVSAVCNEAVKLAAKRKFVNLKGFVNGVLRNIARNPEKCVFPDKDKDYIKYLSVEYSMPEWLISKWIKDYGKEKTEIIIKGFLKKPPTYIRCNTNKITPEKLKEKLEAQNICVEAVSDLPYAFAISGYDYLAGIDGFSQGDFYIQDISSMYAGEAAAPKAGSMVIDVCGAPGGKSINVALLMKEGHIETRDISDMKVSLIEENIKRLGIDNIKARVFDAAVLDEASVQKADLVLADLPCSGLGIIARKPDIKYHMTKEKTEELAALQRQILSTVCQYVKCGGTLVYSTCTINSAENEENAKWFIDNFPFELEGEERQLLPEIDGTDGFFIAKFKRIGE